MNVEREPKQDFLTGYGPIRNRVITLDLPSGDEMTVELEINDNRYLEIQRNIERTKKPRIIPMEDYKSGGK